MSELVSESLPAQEAGTSLSLISLRWGSNEGKNREAGLSDQAKGEKHNGQSVVAIDGDISARQLNHIHMKAVGMGKDVLGMAER